MSSLTVSNVYFDSTGSSRIQFMGSNTITIMTANSEVMRFNANGSMTMPGGTIGNAIFRSITVSTSTPTGGSNGDIWFQV